MSLPNIYQVVKTINKNVKNAALHILLFKTRNSFQDVASRGLHLPHVDWIVQYAAAGSEVEYIHRVGRTARAGSKGHAVLFLLPHEVSYLDTLNKHQIRSDCTYLIQRSEM